ncbi:MAG: MFS transporter [Chloroflexota bacterium]
MSTEPTTGTTRGATGAISSGRVYYGWIIVAASFLIIVITFGSAFSFGVFLTPFRDSFGWTSGATSGVYSLCLFLYTGLAPLSGWSVDQHGPRIISVLGGVLLVAGLLLTSQITALWQLYVTYGLIGMGMSTAYAPLMTTVSRWFPRRRGMAVGIISSGMGTGPLLVAPLASYLISAHGWRTTYLVLGSAAGLIVLAALLLKRNPPPETIPAPVNGQMPADSIDLSLRQALRTRAFYLLAGTFFLVGVGLQVIVTHVVAYSQGHGMAPVLAAGVLSTITGVSIVGRIITGLASDRIGHQKTMAFCLLVEGLSILWLLGATSPWGLFGAAAILGFGYGGHATQFPALTGEMLGLKHMGAILGAAVLLWGIGGAIGSFMGGYIVDLTGSYTSAFLLGTVTFVLAAGTSLFLKGPSR